MSETCREIIKELSIAYWKNEIEKEEVLITLCIFMSKNVLSKSEVSLVIKHVFLSDNFKIKQAVKKANYLLQKNILMDIERHIHKKVRF